MSEKFRSCPACGHADWTEVDEFHWATCEAAARLRATLTELASAAARIVEDDAKPTILHMRTLNRWRIAASNLLDEIEETAKMAQRK